MIYCQTYTALPLINKKSTSDRAWIQIYVTGLDSSILLTMFQLLKLHLVDKRGKSEFGREKKHKKAGLELSTRIRNKM